MKTTTESLINKLLALDEYERKQVAMILLASMLTDLSTLETVDFIYGITGDGRKPLSHTQF